MNAPQEHPLMALCGWRPGKPGEWHGQVPPHWHQGKGAFGGVVAGALVHAFTSLVNNPARHPLTLAVHFCAPLRDEPSVLRAQVVRAGARVTHLSATVEQGGSTAAVALATWGAPRETAVAYQDVEMPKVLPIPDALLVEHNPLMPAFTANFIYRMCGEHLPFAGAPVSNLAAWLRTQEPLALNAVYAASLLDALPPAVFSRLSTPTMASSVDFTMDFFARFPLETPADPQEYYLCTVDSYVASAGYTQQLNRVWRQDGALLGQCRQLVALLG